MMAVWSGGLQGDQEEGVLAMEPRWGLGWPWGREAASRFQAQGPRRLPAPSPLCGSLALG